MLHSILNGSTPTKSNESAVSSFRKMNAIVLLIILFFACNIVYAQESNLQNPESKIVETIDFIQASLIRARRVLKLILKVLNLT